VRRAERKFFVLVKFYEKDARFTFPLHNEWVQFEIGAAEAFGKMIVPVIVSGEEIEETNG
jgi:hypothetical protein